MRAFLIILLFTTGCSNKADSYPKDMAVDNQCEDWCACDEKCKTYRLCLCSNPGKGCCDRGWDRVQSVEVKYSKRD